MISLTRPAEPEGFSSAKLLDEKDKARMFFKNRTGQQEYNFANHLLKAQTRLINLVSHGKCAYCEADINNNEGIIDQFRPKSIYWWLAYTWENQFYVCDACNRYKGARFPVLHAFKLSEIENKTIGELNKLEEPLLIDPCFDIPEKHITYEVNLQFREVEALGKTPRGEQTIEIMGLNRRDLRHERFQAYSDTHLIISAYLQADKSNEKDIARILHRLSAGHLYAGVNRYALQEFPRLNKDVKNIEKLNNVITVARTLFLKQSDSVAEAERSKRGMKTIKLQKESIRTKGIAGREVKDFIIEEIEIKNFRIIDHLFLKLRSIEDNTEHARSKQKPGGADEEKDYRESWLLLLGENGVGKSSVLQAIVLAMLPPGIRKNYIENDSPILRKGAKDGYVKIKTRDGEPIELHFNDEGEITGNVASFDNYLLAYGATRLLPKGDLQPKTRAGKIRVSNLFDYSVALDDAEKWLLSLEKPDFDKACTFIKRLLFLENDLFIEDGKIFTNEKGKKLELGWLSDGYKTLLALAVDILQTYAVEETDIRLHNVSSFARGLILIDEIGTHLHPRWKMSIVERLRNALPKVYFIVTSHEPLCIRGLRKNEVAVLQKDNNDTIIQLENLPDSEGLRVDQLLTSKYFGLNSTMDHELEKKFDEYYSLLGKHESERTAKEKQDIMRLQDELRDRKQLGQNPREELFYYVIDEVVGENLKNNNNSLKIEDMKIEVKNRIESIMKELSF